MKNKQCGFIIPLIIVAVVLLIGGGAYFYSATIRSPQVNQEVISTTDTKKSEVVETSIKSDTNKDTQSVAATTLFVHPTGLYSLKYPSNWKPYTNANDNPGLSYNFKHEKNTKLYEVYGELTFDDDFNNVKFPEPKDITQFNKEQVTIDGFKGYKFTIKGQAPAPMYIIRLDPEKKLDLIIHAEVDPKDSSNFLNEVNSTIGSIKINKDKISLYEQAVSFAATAQNIYDTEVDYPFYEKVISKIPDDQPLKNYPAFEASLREKINKINIEKSMHIDFRMLVENNPLKPVDLSVYKVVPKFNDKKHIVFKIGDKNLGMFFCSSSKGYTRQVSISSEQFEAKTDCENNPLNQPVSELGR